jgi:predicted MFS family arabinose efflux permease
MGDALTITTSLSLVQLSFPDQKAIFIGYLEASFGLGIMLGAPVGSFLFGIFDY